MTQPLPSDVPGPSMQDAHACQSVSILFPGAVKRHETQFAEHDPSYFSDLAIDLVLDAVTKEFKLYDLRPIFRHLPHEEAVIRYRQAVLLDFTNEPLNAAIQAFAVAMIRVRALKALAKKSFNTHQANAYMLAAINLYAETVRALVAGLTAEKPQSKGLRALATAVAAYARSTRFCNLEAQASQCRQSLETVRYTVLLHDGTITVQGFEEQPDYQTTIAEFFARFAQQNPTPLAKPLKTEHYFGNVQSRILDGVAQLNTEIFNKLSEFIGRNSDFIESLLTQFEREAHFYRAWLVFTDALAATGLVFSLPTLATDSKICAQSGFDLALADKLRAKGQTIVPNDFYLQDAERIFVVTGPNQGGKTTFARMLGQMHYFANLGLTVPGRAVRLKFFDHIFTHFEREEALTALHGKLFDDLTRIHDILTTASADSLIILNEIFNSTALKDALFLADVVLHRIIRLGALAVCVTFMDELATLGPETVSLTSMVESDNPSKRSFLIVRRQSDGLAHALSIARKYGVTYEQLKERLR